MNAFNKYLFIDELKKEIASLIDNGTFENAHDIETYIFEEIDNACIYYADCFQIAIELNATEFGESSNITELACQVLTDYVFENIDLSSEIKWNNK